MNSSDARNGATGILCLLLPALIGHAAFAQSVRFGLGTGPVVSDGGISAGVSWADYDGDGDLDLFVTNAQGGDNFLYRNDGGGKLTKVTEGILVTDGARSSGATWGDYDNDGDADLFVANQGGQDNFLYRNEGEGEFTEVAKSSGVADGGESYAAAWVDTDNDGDLDLFVVNGGFGDPEANFFYRNQGDGTFTRITEGAIATDQANSMSASWADYDNDGDQDVFVVNTFGHDNQLYANDGDGTFTRIEEGDIVSDGGYSSAASWGDYDNDGDLDLFVTNGCCALPGHVNFLYRNEGDGTFAKQTRAAVVVDNLDEFGSYAGNWADVDNDGDLDLFVTIWASHNRLYLNDGEGGFSKVIASAVVWLGGDSSGAAWADYDGDGDQDLVVANWSHQDNQFFINRRTGRSWLVVRLVGTDSNRSAVGARIKVRAVIHGKMVEQTREVTTLTAWRGQNGYPHFGLGDAKAVESIVVEWPSGAKQDLVPEAINRQLVIVEGKGIVPEMATEE